MSDAAPIDPPAATARPLERASAFCARYGFTVPIMLAPMAGACPASLSIAIANAGGMGAMGALPTPPTASATARAVSGAARPHRRDEGSRLTQIWNDARALLA